MSEHPIIFSGPMIKAILAGAKTQTRRVIKPQPQWRYPGNNSRGVVFSTVRGRLYGTAGFGLAQETWCIPECPYGVPGDLLWVRETWSIDPNDCMPDTDLEWTRWHIGYRADDPDAKPTHWGWHPSIYMPRWASRLTLRIESVRVERLQDITEADAQAEGTVIPSGYSGCSMHPYNEYTCVYRELWDKLNAKRGYAWTTNPWVWVIGFAKESKDA
jgi:hypothetical protein